MTISTENILLIGSILLFISLIAGKTSYRFGFPVLILFLSVGMLAGSEGIGKIYFDNPLTAQFTGIVALNFILFSGGLDTDWESMKKVFWKGISLSTAGVMITAFAVGIFVWAITDFSIYEGLLLGSIISSTDSAAVFSILRSKSVALKGTLRPVLELESGSNDPMAYILTLLFTSIVVQQSTGLSGVAVMFFSQLILGGLAGFLLGKAGTWIINHIKLEYEGLYVVLVIAIMFFNFSFTNFIGGNGFLAVYISAVLIGSRELIHKKTIMKSFDSFAWLMQIILFLTLGLLVYPSHIIPVIGIGLLISAFLMFVARPVAVFTTLIPFNINNRSKLLISWVGLRGAVPIVFATIPLLAGASKASIIFDIVFFVSITSVIIQGTTLTRVADWLHLTLPKELKQRTQKDMEFSEGIKSLLTHIVVPDNSPIIGQQLVELKMPKNTLISIIERDNSYITPHGATTIEPNDQLYVLSENKDALAEVFECLKIEKN